MHWNITAHSQVTQVVILAPHIARVATTRSQAFQIVLRRRFIHRAMFWDNLVQCSINIMCHMSSITATIWTQTFNSQLLSNYACKKNNGYRTCYETHYHRIALQIIFVLFKLNITLQCADCTDCIETFRHKQAYLSHCS